MSMRSTKLVMQHRPSRRPYSVQVFLVARVMDRLAYLLFLRHPKPKLGLPAFWQGVSGALEAGESFEQAAVREVLEESQMSVQEVYYTHFTRFFPIREEWRSAYGQGPTEVEERVFYAVAPAITEPVLSAEHQAWRWCTFEEADALLEFGANRQCLHAVEKCFIHNEE